jgi:peptidoglycan-associated lipoprotein
MEMKSYALAAWLVSLPLAVGCGSDPKPPPEPPPGPAQPLGPPVAAQNPSDGKPGDDPNKSQINISDEIRKKCGISETDAHFAYDSANVRPEDKRVLAQLAKCFKDGPLAGRHMRLVGHADPRGEDEYNMLLGQRRADNVKMAVAGEGLGQEQMETTSRGEMDASGTDEPTWSRDRRVDIVLAD